MDLGCISASLGRIPALASCDSLRVRSSGEDRIPGTSDDVTVATFRSDDIAVAAAAAISAVVGISPPVDGERGAILGRVSHDGVPLAGVSIGISGCGESGSAISDDDGRFAFLLAPGLYQLLANKPGYAPTSATVSVNAHGVSEVVLSMGLASPAMDVTVTDSLVSIEPSVMYSLSPMASLSPEGPLSDRCIHMITKSGGGPEEEPPPYALPSPVSPLYTPRLRTEFPETLLWQPELITGSDGRLSVPVTLADAVTTWKVQAVASTVDGGFATAETEVVASLPFYLELDTPPLLTRGDTVYLPVLVRNYTAQEQEVRVKLEPGTGLELQGGAEASLQVAASHTGRVSFPVHAAKPATTRVAASGHAADAGDALQRSLEVVPNGEELRHSDTTILRDRVELGFSLPAETVPGTATVSLRLFPNLAAHLREGMEDLLHRPVGCGEQITSTAWVAMLLLENLETMPAADAVLEERAHDTVVTAVAELSKLASQEGGIKYWPQGKPNLLLTAHVLRFLVHATDHTKGGEKLLRNAATWLSGLQDEDGGWRRMVHHGPDGATQSEQYLIQDTAFIACALAAAAARDGEQATAAGEAADLALAFLEPQLHSFQEPYTLAAFALASAARDHQEQAAWARQQLVALARFEGSAAYWQVHRNTPLFGWGLPGRLESTALSVLALAAEDTAEHRQLCDAGLLYLLHHKDEGSTWYSTLATVTALEAISTRGLAGSTGGELQVMPSWGPPQVIALPSADQVAGAISVELPAPPIAENLAVTLQRSGGDAALAAQLQQRFYLPWSAERPQVTADNLSLDVSYDRTSTAIRKTVSCVVRAARVAYRGHGMLLAEVGLPPGAEVDRRSLEQALSWSDSYELRPDRVILYLWARAGGSTISFSFKPRLAGDMASAPSLLYDYYNPEQRVVLEPQRFVITVAE